MARNRIHFRLIATAIAFLAAFPGSVVAAQETNSSVDNDEFALVEYPIAILPFKTRGKEVEGMGDKVSDLMFAELVVDPTLQLVDREDLDKVLTEAEINLTGLANPAEAIQIGNLTGAKLLVTGSVFQHDDSIYVVSKIIGTETTRVIGASAKGHVDGKLDELVSKLGKQVIGSIKKTLLDWSPKRSTRNHALPKSKRASPAKNCPKSLFRSRNST